MPDSWKENIQRVREALISWHIQTPTQQRANAQKARATLAALTAQIEEFEDVLRGISHANDAVPPGAFKADPDKLLEWCCRQARAALAQSDPPDTE